MGFIYKITNNINNKIYIGKTKYTIEKRFNGHIKRAEHNDRNYPLYNAMNKYGIENFSISVIEECSEDLLNEREKFWISKFNSTDREIGYNLTLGGEGGDTYSYQSEERKLEISKLKSEHSGMKLGSPGRTKRLATIKRTNICSISHLGKTPWNKGLTMEEHEGLKKLSNSLKEYYKTHDGVQKGKPRTEEEKIKISNGMKGKKNGVGNKSNTGKKWLHKDGKNIIVFKEEIQKYLDDGWEFGICNRNHIPYNAQPVIDITHNKTYYCVKEASKATGISEYFIKKSILNNEPYNGIIFRYIDKI